MDKSSLSIPRQILFCWTFILLSCSSISLFDQHAYLQATSLKVDALSLMEDGGDSYEVHEKEIRELTLKMQKAYEYEKFRPQNDITSKMYGVLIDPNGNLLGGYLVLWKLQGKLGKLYIEQKREQVSLAFDEIARLESKKIKNK